MSRSYINLELADRSYIGCKNHRHARRDSRRPETRRSIGDLDLATQVRCVKNNVCHAGRSRLSEI